MKVLRSSILNSILLLALSAPCSASSYVDVTQYVSATSDIKNILFDREKLQNATLYHYIFSHLLTPSPLPSYAGGQHIIVFSHFIRCERTRTVKFEGVPLKKMINTDPELPFEFFKDIDTAKLKFDDEKMILRMHYMDRHPTFEPETIDFYEVLVQFKRK